MFLDSAKSIIFFQFFLNIFHYKFTKHHYFACRFNGRFILPRSYSGSATQSYWGRVCGNVAGELVPVSRRMNAVEYVELLDHVLLPSIRAIHGDDQGNIHEVVNVIKDNNGAHTANIVKEWYRKQPFINRLDFPARSPELNII